MKRMRIDWALKAPTVFAQNANAQNTNGGLDAPVKQTLQTVLYQFLQKLAYYQLCVFCSRAEKLPQECIKQPRQANKVRIVTSTRTYKGKNVINLSSNVTCVIFLPRDMPEACHFG
jgi:hypothetical protein